MRVGKFVEHFRAAAVASDAKSMDPVLRFTSVGRQLGYAMYMLCDNACVVRTSHLPTAQVQRKEKKGKRREEKRREEKGRTWFVEEC
jgi:hypothetical protein